MNKIWFLFVTFLWVSLTTSNGTVLETPHTLIVPWTVDHSFLWEKCEAYDNSLSYFRRNEYFEDINTLMIRDKNWLSLCNFIRTKKGYSFVFPDLGYAILDKISNQLIGTIRFTLSEPGYLSIGYGLIPEVRNRKLGNEILQKIIMHSDIFIGSPIIGLKPEITKSVFMAEWYEQGKKETPNFDTLINLLHDTPLPFCGINACVNIYNQGSLTILLRSNMQPTEVECTKYFLDDQPNLFCFDFCLTYPPKSPIINFTLENFINDMLSRDSDRITHTTEKLKKIFNIPDNWIYLALNRSEKAELRVQKKIITTTLLSDLGFIKKTNSIAYIPPYCFVD